jgi:hypothetical protein
VTGVAATITKTPPPLFKMAGRELEKGEGAVFCGGRRMVEEGCFGKGETFEDNDGF